MSNTRLTEAYFERVNERGAALITSILISMLLLTVAGTVILTSAMSATTAVESTSEVQAYYGAESGLEAALNVLRGNVEPRTGMPTGTKIGFRNAVDLTTSNLVGDTTTVARLSGWLPYANDRITPSGANYAYSVTVNDPDDPNGILRTSDGTYRPSRLVVQSTGYGPRGSIKRMEMVVERTQFEFDPSCTVCGISSEDGSKGTWAVGSSNAKFYTGHDTSGGDDLPTFGVTSPNDVDAINDAITKPDTVEDEKVAQLDSSTLPEWLQSADKAREFLNYMQGVARSVGRYYTSFSGDAGSAASPQFTFVNGDCTLDGGAGLLIVTGKLMLNGNRDFTGVVLVLGEGYVERQGAGNGDILGSMYVAKFARSWPASENGLPHPFLAVHFNTDGGGNGDMIYDSAAVATAKQVLGMIVRDVREF
ncbi:MAG TPA: pilus assembly PilX N-terminal domain-containing protein [Pyrinomonadaceae bacterium]|nr:pilus assembly PilX N-terminal domain-containing protein [Pyrinomonadaceae bacterium]